MATTPNSALAGLVANSVTGLSPFSRHAVNAGNSRAVRRVQV